MFNPSPEQSNFFTALTTERGNILLGACAGSGKSTTCFKAMELLPKILEGSFMPPKIVYIAFASDVVAAAKARVPRGVEVVTCHALGRRALVNIAPAAYTKSRDWVDGRKLSKRLYKLLGDSNDVKDAIRLGSVARSQFVMPEDMNGDYLHTVAERYGFIFDDPAGTFRAVQKAIVMGAEDLSTIDFDEMLYLPIVLNASFDKQDYVFVDEAQDTNDIQLEILARLDKHNRTHTAVKMGLASAALDGTDCGSTTRFIFVGDPHQAIYAFRGANSDSMERISARFSCKEMPLSVSFRCPQSVVAEAQKFLQLK